MHLTAWTRLKWGEMFCMTTTSIHVALQTPQDTFASRNTAIHPKLSQFCSGGTSYDAACDIVLHSKHTCLYLSPSCSALMGFLDKYWRRLGGMGVIYIVILVMYYTASILATFSERAERVSAPVFAMHLDRGLVVIEGKPRRREQVASRRQELVHITALFVCITDNA